MDEPPPAPPRTAVPPTVTPSAEAAPSAAPVRRERAFNAPWVVTGVAALLVAAFLAQRAAGGEAVIAQYGLVPLVLSAGRIEGLFTHIFLHGGWLHLFLNATALFAFGAPVARLFGSSAVGALRFAAYFMLCGTIGGLTFWALHPSGVVPVVGASGAISGLMGGAARLVAGPGVVSRTFSRSALQFVIPWIVLNLLIALAGAALGPAVPIAWEAHLGGLVAGLLLLGAFAPRSRSLG